MPRKGTRRPESPRERSRPSRPKLDARLQFLLSLPPERLTALVQTEGRRLQEVAEEIRSARAAVEAEATESGKSRAGERLRAAEARLFGPVSSGFHVVDGPRRPTGPRVRFAEPFISAFIISDASSADLADLGVQVRSRSGDVFTAFIPVSAIPRLEASAAVRYVELERPAFPALQSALVSTQIAQLHTPPGGGAGHTGAGVIVGIVDLEILDVYHPAFRTATDATRVLYLWDQTLSAQDGETAPAGTGLLAPNGVEYDQATIDAELAPGHPVYSIVRHAGVPDPVDIVFTHGTFVTGIAAGNGRQPGQAPTNVGAAPAADIIYVRSQLPPATELFVGANLLMGQTYICDAFAYIFARAGQLGRPCVVNLSASDDQGPHDGTTAGERFIDDLLLTPGRAITVSAGNANNTESHASGAVGQGATVDLKLNYANLADSSDIIEIWYDGHDRFAVTVTLPTGDVIGTVQPGTSQSLTLANGVEVSVTSVLDSPLNHDNVITVIIEVNGQQVPAGDWTFALTGTQVINGAFHAWVDRNNRNQSAWALPAAGAPGRAEGHFTLSVPATARRVITVGNHAEPPPPPAPQNRAIDTLSGRGPTRDGRIKPELAAVGTAIRAPRSRDMRLANPGSLYVTKGPATSWSAPLVAGACALLFECRGASATWANLKQILTETAGTAGLVVPGDDFGFGYLQAGLACTGPLPAVDTWLRDDPADTGIEPFTGPVAWASPDIEVLDTAGNPVANPTHHPTNRFSNIVRVTVRNRGSQPARNTEVFLYWADPATNIPYPSAWNGTGFFTGPPPFVAQGNSQVVPLLPPGASTPVLFAWAPPAPGTNLRQDNHFCLLVRVENEGDLPQVGIGGWSVITARNNVALRNVLVQPSPSTLGFWVVGSADQDSLIIRPQEAEIELLLPIAALPWRDRRFIERHGPRPRYARPGSDDPLRALKTTLKGDDIGERTDVFGATSLELHDGIAHIRATAERGLVLRSLRLLEGARVPVRLNVKAHTEAGPRFVHVAQYSGGQLVGGVSLQFGRTEYRAGRSA
jgi:hypothetical protein